MTKMICDPVLLAKLKKANKLEISDLIDVITDFGRGRVALDADIKKKLVVAKNKGDYNEDILSVLAREIQGYGGNSIWNIVRSVSGSDLVSYDEIVSDVYSTIVNKKTTSSVTQKEIEVAKKIFGDKWDKLSSKERYAECLKAIYNITALLKKSLWSILPISPIKMVTDPVESITIPCVSILGCMELRLKNMPMDNKTHSLSVLQLEHQQPISKILDENGDELLSLKEYNSNIMLTNKTRNVSKEQISRFNSLLSSAPGLINFAELQKGGYVLCDIPLDQLANSRAVDGAKRGFMHGSDGRIQQHVNLSEADPLQVINIAGLVWSGLSIAVAQKHMQDISEKLTVIIEKLDEIFDEIEHFQVDKLTGQIKYIQSFLQEDTTSLSQQELNSIENCLKENYELADTFERRLTELFEKSMSNSDSSIFSHNTDRDNVLKQAKKINDLLMNYIQTMYLRITLNALLYANSDQNKGRFVKSAEEAVQKIDELGRPLGGAIQYLRAKAELSNSLISSADNFIKEISPKLQGMVDLVAASQIEAKQLYRVTLEKPIYQTRLKIVDGEVVEALEYQLV